MSKRTCVAVLLLVAAGTVAPAQEKKTWQPHPFAPSIPLLSDAEYGKIDKIIDDFIEYDSGKLPGANGKKILADFDALGPEAVPPLIEGLNKAGNLQASCPAVIIAKKLKKLVGSTTDGQLCDYVRESVGAGVTIVRHMGSIKDLKIACMLRKSYLQQTGQLVPPGKKSPKAMSIEELAEAAGKEKTQYLKQILTELEQRQGEKVAVALGMAITRPEPDIKALAQNLLIKHLARQNAAVLKGLLKSTQEEVRHTVVYVIGAKKLPWGSELIDALEDGSPRVQQLARQALIQLAGGKDFGPAPTASVNERTEAIKAWRHWWKSKSGAGGLNK